MAVDIPRETLPLRIGNTQFSITGTPCEHLPGGEVVGFIIAAPSFGTTAGKPNAIYFSGDTIYLPELAKMREKFRTQLSHPPFSCCVTRLTLTVNPCKDISVALLNLGRATAPLPSGPLQITMDGAQGARLFREIGAEVLVPMHFGSFKHFLEPRDEMERALESEGDKVVWLKPGVKTKLA